MTREECEQAILEHVKGISEIYREYAPEENYLTISLSNNHIDGNGNDYGDWDTISVDCWNQSEDKKILFHAWMDIDNEKYRSVMDKFYEAYPEEEKEDPKWDFYNR